MTAFTIAPSLDISLVVLRGIIQVDEAEAKAHCQCEVTGTKCWGFCMDDLPVELFGFEKKLRRLTDQWLARMITQGYDPVGSDVRVHGPFDSHDFMNRMVDVGDPDWNAAKRKDQNGDDNPSLYLRFVHDVGSAPAFKDYVLVHQFLKRNVLTEVIINDPS